MTGLNSAVSAALSGLDAFAEGIGTVGTNIANQTSSGYGVRTLDVQTASDGASQSGAGVVDPALVRRVSDAVQASNVYSATAASTGAAALSSALTAIDQAFTGNGDVQGAASTFFADLGTLASEPSNTAQVGTVLADAQSLVGSFNSAALSLSQQNAQIVTQAGQQVAQANTLLDQIAAINKQLRAAPGDASLLDQQQAALTKLSSYLAIKTIPLGESGAVAVMSGGTVLVDQSGPQPIEMTQAQPQDAPQLTAGADKGPLSLSKTGGSLGGLLSGFASVSAAGQQLDWIAGTVAGLVNRSQAEGLDATGSPGKPLFSVPGPTVTAGAGNTGTASLSPTITNPGALPANGQGYTLSYSATGWTATVPGTAQSYALGTASPLTLNGMNIAVTGTPNPGDSFRIAPETGAAASMKLTATDPGALAVADPYVLVAGSIAASGAVSNSNAGTLSEGIDTVTTTPAPGAAVVPAPPSGSTLEIRFTSASAYTVVDTATGSTVSTGTFGGGGTNIAIAYPAGSPATGSYWQVNLTGSPAAGDVATLTPGGLNSGSNARRMADLWTSTDASVPGGSLQGAVLSLIGSTGADAAAAKTLAANTASNLSTAQGNLSQVAGVDENRQAALLSEFQQAYQAAAKVIATANAMFQSLIQVI
ncbi:MAG: hypothetical protein KGN33_14505 [Paracoccaceae bacterium]|nr:hypothetical protein [Paracoccaceae bacterium]